MQAVSALVFATQSEIGHLEGRRSIFSAIIYWCGRSFDGYPLDPNLNERQEIPMFASPKLMGVFVGFAVALMADNAGAISVELAKKCDALTAKGFHRA
jgi:hypothetical protein